MASIICDMLLVCIVATNSKIRHYYAALGTALMLLGLVAIFEWALSLYDWYCRLKKIEGEVKIFGLDLGMIFSIVVSILLIQTAIIFYRLYYFERRDIFRLSSIITIGYALTRLCINVGQLLMDISDNNPFLNVYNIVAPYISSIVWILVGTSLYIIGDIFLNNRLVRISSLFLVAIVLYPFGLLLAGKELMKVSIKS